MFFFLLLSWFGVFGNLNLSLICKYSLLISLFFFSVFIPVLISFFILSLATGLYYLAELIEEYTTTSAKVIRYINWFVVFVYVCLFLFEDLPNHLILFGLLSHLNHILILKTFPFFQLSSPSFIIFIALLVLNHYLAFSYFAHVNLYFIQVLSYFTICLWVIPFAFFVSLSANDNVLPTSIENHDNNDLITHYFSRKGHRSGLLSFFNYAKESVLPQQVKKSY